MPETFNRDVAAMAKKVYELSTLSPAALDARKWEAMVLLTAAYASATPEALAEASAWKDARWGAKIKQEGLVSAFHPKWHLRTDDGKPPVVQVALESGLTNPDRSLHNRLSTLAQVPPNERPALVDVVRAFVGEAFSGATGDARNRYIDRMRAISPDWFRTPWLTIVPPGGGVAPASILVENQGPTHDGGIYDDPADDSGFKKWKDGIRTWDVDFLRDNPLSQLYLGVESAFGAARSVLGAWKWILGGVAVVGAGVVIYHFATRPKLLSLREELQASGRLREDESMARAGYYLSR